VAHIYDNWQSILDDPPDGLNAHSYNGCTPANSNHKPKYCAQQAAWAMGNNPKGAE
jgi:hypothetical protein